MILVLGIGGSFPYGFHISVINYPSKVSDSAPSFLWAFSSVQTLVLQPGAEKATHPGVPGPGVPRAVGWLGLCAGVAER